VAVPVSVRVRVCVGLVWPTVVLGKERLPAESVSAETELEPDELVDPLLQPTIAETANKRHPERRGLLTMGLCELR
jgi:hypothetical protein